MSCNKSPFNNIKQKVANGFTQALVRGVAHIPFGVLYPLSDILYYPVYHLVRYRRKIVHRNLTESFPEKSAAEIKRIERGFYHFLCDTFLEACKMLTMSFDEMRRRCRFVNVEVLNSIVDRGQSLSVYIGHLGNWEWISSSPLWIDKRATVVQLYHKLRNESVDRLMGHMRGRFGGVNVEMYDTVRYIVNARRTGQLLAIGVIADQSPKFKEIKDWTQFLNHTVPVLTGPEKFIKHFGQQVLFMSVTRPRRGYYELEFKTLVDNPQSLPDYQLTDIYFRHLEQEIRRNPELYLWSHKRFKHAK